MEKSKYSAPDNFSISPFLALLPVLGSVSDLEQMSNSMFARYEKVNLMKKGFAGAVDSDDYRKILAEEAMLKHVLDWLSISIEGKK
ncbi:MAG: hypothetical protein ACOX2O_03285 [Bdellovibrionota bacterium]|jgi:hypothetical protein